MKSAQHTIIKSSIWTDEDFHVLSDEHQNNILWVLTNDNITPAGVQKLNRIKFELERKKPFDSLLQALAGLPRAFKRYGPDGSFLWSVNFIRHQWRASTLASNNMAKAIYKSIIDLPDPTLIADILREYPQLRDALADKGDESPSKPFGALRRAGVGKDRYDKVQGKGAGKGIPDDAEVIEWAAAWPGQPATGLDGPIPDAIVARCLARWDGSTYGWPPNWQRALISAYREALTGGSEKNGAKKNSSPNWVRVRDIKERLSQIDREENALRLSGLRLEDETDTERRALEIELARLEPKE